MLVNPAWRKIVRLEDYDYISKLWEDFTIRAGTEPRALFGQLTSLTVGPLVTSAVGQDLSVLPELQALVKDFVDICGDQEDREPGHNNGLRSFAD